MNKKPDPQKPGPPSQESQEQGSDSNSNSNSNSKSAANEDVRSPPFVKLEQDIRELRIVVESNLDAIASELMRAEARDEWMTQQITESRRILRSQSQTLDAIQTAIQQGVRGLH